jgi:hypothetical protein
MTEPFPDDVDQQRWDEACRRADAIRDFLRQQPDGSTIGDVARLAAELGLSRATIYRLIKVFRKAGPSHRFWIASAGGRRGLGPSTKSGNRSSAPRSRVSI